MKTTYRNLRYAFVLGLLLFLSVPAHAGIPVVDGVHNMTSMMNLFEGIARTLKQIEQYSTQLSQYENQLQNTVGPPTYIWDRAQSSINGLLGAVNTLEYYKNNLGNLDTYLRMYQDLEHYRDMAGLTARDPTPGQKAALEESRRFASESEKRSYDASIRGIDQQQQALRNDAQTLERLQANAQSADGQMQAMQYANQLASSQSNQLLQIRALLMTEQNAIVTRQQAVSDREAQQEASAEMLRQGEYRQSSGRAW